MQVDWLSSFKEPRLQIVLAVAGTIAVLVLLGVLTWVWLRQTRMKHELQMTALELGQPLVPPELTRDRFRRGVLWISLCSGTIVPIATFASAWKLTTESPTFRMGHSPDAQEVAMLAVIWSAASIVSVSAVVSAFLLKLLSAKTLGNIPDKR